MSCEVCGCDCEEEEARAPTEEEVTAFLEWAETLSDKAKLEMNRKLFGNGEPGSNPNGTERK